MNHSRYGTDRASHEDPYPSSQQPLAQAQGGKGDPSALSVTMLSSDYSSFQQNAPVLKPSPSSTASKPNSFPLRASPGGTVTVPTGEMEPSEQSFESSVTTASEESAQDTTRSPPLFQRVEGPHLTKAVMSTATAPARPPRTTEVSVSDMTGSDVQELTSTTSKSTSSAGGNDSSENSSATSGGVGGSLRPPIKGILKHPAERRTDSSSVAAPSVSSRRGKGKAVPTTTK